MRSTPFTNRSRLSVSNTAQQLRGLFHPQWRPNAYLPGSSTLYGQFWMGQSLWRPSALWAAVAGLMASGALNSLQALDWRDLALMFLLVDLLWGSIWRLSGGREHLLPLRSQPGAVQARLPYLQPDSPAAQLFHWNSADVWPWLLRVALPSVVITLLVAATMGKVALILTFCVLLLTAAGWVMRRNFALPPALSQAMVTIALPWLLALWRQGVTPQAPLWNLHLTLLALWTLHYWGEGRMSCLQNEWFGIVLLVLSDIGLLLLMVVARLPLWLALLTFLILPTWITIVSYRSVQRLTFWWWIAMMLSALAISQA